MPKRVLTLFFNRIHRFCIGTNPSISLIFSGTCMTLRLDLAITLTDCNKWACKYDISQTSLLKVLLYWSCFGSSCRPFLPQQCCSMLFSECAMRFLQKDVARKSLLPFFPLCMMSIIVGIVQPCSPGQRILLKGTRVCLKCLQPRRNVWLHMNVCFA